MNNNAGYPVWTAPVAAGHKIANVREMKRAQDGTLYFVSYSIVLPKNGFHVSDWDYFVLAAHKEGN